MWPWSHASELVSPIVPTFPSSLAASKIPKKTQNFFQSLSIVKNFWMIWSVTSVTVFTRCVLLLTSINSSLQTPGHRWMSRRRKLIRLYSTPWSFVTSLSENSKYSIPIYSYFLTVLDTSANNSSRSYTCGSPCGNFDFLVYLSFFLSKIIQPWYGMFIVALMRGFPWR